MESVWFSGTSSTMFFKLDPLPLLEYCYPVCDSAAERDQRFLDRVVSGAAFFLGGVSSPWHLSLQSQGLSTISCLRYISVMLKSIH